MCYDDDKVFDIEKKNKSPARLHIISRYSFVS